jgi:hypothetical protein
MEKVMGMLVDKEDLLAMDVLMRIGSNTMRE